MSAPVVDGQDRDRRSTTAITEHRSTGDTRLLTALLDGFIVVGGVPCLSNPFVSPRPSASSSGWAG